MRRDESKNSEPRPRRHERGVYANFFQIAHNMAEFLIEFGQEDGSIHTRVYLSPQHARIFSELLSETLRGHEKMFGPIVSPLPDRDRNRQ
jgi:hypothetical protein